jgi:hypothetical protein
MANDTSVATCPAEAPFVDDKQCVRQCPLDKRYLETGDVCVAQCTPGRRPDGQGICQPIVASSRDRVALAVTLPLAALVIAVAAWGAVYWRRRTARYAKAADEVGISLMALALDRSDVWEFSRALLHVQRKLASGHFADVYLADAAGIAQHAARARAAMQASVRGRRRWRMFRRHARDVELVAVKAVRAGATTEDVINFHAETALMKCLDHPHIVSMLGEGRSQATVSWSWSTWPTVTCARTWRATSSCLRPHA